MLNNNEEVIISKNQQKKKNRQQLKESIKEYLIESNILKIYGDNERKVFMETIYSELTQKGYYKGQLNNVNKYFNSLCLDMWKKNDLNFSELLELYTKYITNIKEKDDLKFIKTRYLKRKYIESLYNELVLEFYPLKRYIGEDLSDWMYELPSELWGDEKGAI